jgi:hypothetical protein
MKEDLANAKHNQRIEAAADDGQRQRGKGGAAEFAEESFHIFGWEELNQLHELQGLPGWHVA